MTNETKPNGAIMGIYCFAAFIAGAAIMASTMKKDMPIREITPITINGTNGYRVLIGGGYTNYFMHTSDFKVAQ